MSEPMIHPIERIRDAFERAHAICVGSRAHYMSIPPNPERDADLILTDAIEELAALRARVAELEREVERVREAVASVCDEWVHGADHSTDWLLSKLMPIAQRGAALAPRADVQPAPTRCEVCGWTLAESRDKGCVAGDCSYRPEQGSDEWYRIKARREALAARPEVKP